MPAQTLTYDYVRVPSRRSTFEARLIQAGDEIIIMEHRAFPSKPLIYGGATVVAAGYDVVWFLLKGRPYDVGRFYRPDGTWTGYYVDILEPVQWRDADARTLEPIADLVLDLWIAPDGGLLVLDEDELEEAVRAGHLAPDREREARRVLADIVAQAGRGAFPPAIAREFAR